MASKPRAEKSRAAKPAKPTKEAKAKPRKAAKPKAKPSKVKAKAKAKPGRSKPAARARARAFRADVVYAVDARKVSDGKLRSALAKVARDFDEAPSEMVCVLGAPINGVTWFTFGASVWSDGDALASGFFIDVLSEALPELVVVEHEETNSELTKFSHYVGGELELQVRTRGDEVAVSRGALAHAPARGEAIAACLDTIGWPTHARWDALLSNGPERWVQLRDACRARARGVRTGGRARGSSGGRDLGRSLAWLRPLGIAGDAALRSQWSRRGSAQAGRIADGLRPHVARKCVTERGRGTRR